MATITFTSRIDDVLANVTSVALSDPTGTYGVQRRDTGAVVVADGTTMDNPSTGQYSYTFTPVGGVTYDYYVEWIYGGETHHVSGSLTAAGDTSALTGLTLKEVIRTILANDAKLTGADNLGTLLEYNGTTKPETVFYQYPPEHISPPILTYRIAGENGWEPRNVYFDVLAWGGQLKAIQNRVYDLLNERLEVQATDWQVKGIFFESSGPELYDDNLKVYFQRARYRVVCWKI